MVSTPDRPKLGVHVRATRDDVHIPDGAARARGRAASHPLGTVRAAVDHAAGGRAGIPGGSAGTPGCRLGIPLTRTHPAQAQSSAMANPPAPPDIGLTRLQESTSCRWATSCSLRGLHREAGTRDGRQAHRRNGRLRADATGSRGPLPSLMAMLGNHPFALSTSARARTSKMRARSPAVRRPRR